MMQIGLVQNFTWSKRILKFNGLQQYQDAMIKKLVIETLAVTKLWDS